MADDLDDLIARGMGFMTSCHVYNARSPNVEVTEEDEILDLLGQDAETVMKYYTMTAKGNWEEGKNILYAGIMSSIIIDDLCFMANPINNRRFTTSY